MPYGHSLKKSNKNNYWSGASIGVLSVGITMGAKAETVGRYKVYLIK